MFEGKFKGNKALKKKVRREYKALKKSGDVKSAKEAGLSRKEMKKGIRESIAEKAIVRRKAFAVKKASDTATRKESMAGASKDMATERANRAAERQASMQTKADVANKKKKESDIISKNNTRVRGNISRRKDAGGGEYEFKEKDGTTARRRTLTPEEIAKAKKEGKLNYGGSVKTVKKAQEGGKVKSKSFGVLKSDANKTGPKMEEGKKPFTKNGITYTWDRKNSVWRGDVKGNEGVGKKSRAVKKAKNGGKVSDPTKKPKSKEVEPLLNKNTKLGKFINAAGTALGGPTVWTIKGVKNIKKLREDSGMDPKKKPVKK